MLVLGVSDQSSDRFEMLEETGCNYSEDGVGRDCHQHSQYPTDMASHEQDYEYFQRAGFDAGRVDERLEEEVVHHLGYGKDGYKR